MESRVWHTRFGQGEILNNAAEVLTVRFGCGEKNISNSAWLSCLFLCEGDSLETDTEKLKTQYNELGISFPSGLRADASINKFRQIRDAILPHDISLSPRRRLCILSCTERAFSYKPHIEIIALDVESKKLVGVVDSNGAVNGACSRTKQSISIKPGMEIDAMFKPCKQSGHLSLYRIVSEYTLLSGETNPAADLQENDISVMLPVLSFNEVEMLCRNSQSLSFYTACRFSGSRIHAYTSKSNVLKYQIKMDRLFVDVEDPFHEMQKLADMKFVGKALLAVRIDSRGHAILVAKRLFGSFSSKPDKKKQQGLSTRTMLKREIGVKALYAYEKQAQNEISQYSDMDCESEDEEYEDDPWSPDNGLDEYEREAEDFYEDGALWDGVQRASE